MCKRLTTPILSNNVHRIVDFRPLQSKYTLANFRVCVVLSHFYTFGKKAEVIRHGSIACLSLVFCKHNNYLNIDFIQCVDRIVGFG